MQIPLENLTVENHLEYNFQAELKTDVRNGLTGESKTLPSKYFYDERGSELFEDICRTPEYYVTRTELQLLEEIATQVMEGFDEGDLVELGSGSHWKIQRLFEAACPSTHSSLRYVPVDVSESALRLASEALLAEYPDIRIHGLVADFTRHLVHVPVERPLLVVLFGSSIGNFGTRAASGFLAHVAKRLKPNDRFLLSVDRVKDPEILNAAYNDSQGVTAAFNKNILRVINENLEADFSLNDFTHKAFFDEKTERVEMHLEANTPIRASIAALDMEVEMQQGETIHTEISQKYTRDSALEMVHGAGLELLRWHHGQNEWFSVMELQRRD